ncbi:F-box domain containing protein [Pandoravirus quercus]|uniref:F-box domain containing protein n=1 Tax=Pandoravirus quercus TaxID=2107709 RepID=A0A2U7U7V4_9VIRU|nr:F-box domain containing protein [Pandoravirus quercus]AVK74502.1 F-box domain containing protein [Pandoravirus quercus]
MLATPSSHGAVPTITRTLPPVTASACVRGRATGVSRGPTRKARAQRRTGRLAKRRAQAAQPMDLVEPSAERKQTDVSSSSTSIEVLPDEVLAQVMDHLPCMDRRHGGPACVSHRWRSITLDQKTHRRPACAQGFEGKDPYASAVRLFHVDCIEYALERRCTQTVNACVEAAARGRLDLAVRFCKRGCKWDAPEMAVAAAAAGHLHALAALHETGAPTKDPRVCTAAAAGGHLSCLEYAHTAGFPWDAKTAAGAAAAGSLDCLTYLHRRGCPWDSKATNAALDPDWFKHPRPVSDIDVRDDLDGRLACLRYLIANECPWHHDAFEVAAGSGSQILALALDLGCPFDVDIDDDVGDLVVCSGDAESVTLLAARGYKWGWSDLNEAVRFGQPQMLGALIDAGAPWDTDLAARLVRHNDSELMQWVIDRGLAWDIEKCMMEAIPAYGTLYRWFVESGYECPRLAKFCLHAVKCHQHETLEWLLAHDFPWDPVAGAALMPDIGNYCLAVLANAGLIGAGPCEDSAALCDLAAGHDYKHDGGATIKTLYALGHRGDARATAAAGTAGNIETLRWLVGQGCPVDHTTMTTISAAWGDHVDCLRYLCEAGYACDADVYAAAIRGGNIACLAYLDQRRCPRPDHPALLASQSGRLSPLRYLREQIGVPLHPDACVIAIQEGSVTCLRYAHNHGCEIDMDRCMAALDSCWSARTECERYLVAQRDAGRPPSPPLQKP